MRSTVHALHRPQGTSSPGSLGPSGIARPFRRSRISPRTQDSSPMRLSAFAVFGRKTRNAPRGLLCRNKPDHPRAPGMGVGSCWVAEKKDYVEDVRRLLRCPNTLVSLVPAKLRKDRYGEESSMTSRSSALREETKSHLFRDRKKKGGNPPPKSVMSGTGRPLQRHLLEEPLGGVTDILARGMAVTTSISAPHGRILLTC